MSLTSYRTAPPRDNLKSTVGPEDSGRFPDVREEGVKSKPGVNDPDARSLSSVYLVVLARGKTPDPIPNSAVKNHSADCTAS